MATKEEIINQIINDLPSQEYRGQLTNDEWYGWFEECWDKAVKATNEEDVEDTYIPLDEIIVWARSTPNLGNLPSSDRVSGRIDGVNWAQARLRKAQQWNNLRKI